jgi:oxygen-independent coproporphyrinogen-3 oxidase
MAVCRELAARSLVVDRPVSSVYIGGGTPNLLGPSGLEFLAASCREHFVLSPNVEWTIEVNSDSLTPDFLKVALQSGINRLSLGVQCLNDNLLRLIGRLHTAKEAREAFLLASGIGFKNISVDLLYGLPAQTPDDFQAGLTEVLGWDPQHVALCPLTVAPGSGLYEEYEEGTLPLAPESIVADIYAAARDALLEAGFEHYEISNFARSGFTSLHNLNDWERGPCLGLGAGAESHIGSTRTRNIEDPTEYVRLLGSEYQLDKVILEHEDLSLDLEARDALISALRTTRGIDVNEYDRRFGTSVLSKYRQSIQTLCQAGLVELANGRLRLSHRGFMLSHLVFREFL